MPVKKNNKLIIIPVITLLAGFVSFVILSIHFKVFWITSKYDVPLIYNVSVMVGDFIILPILNYKIFNLFIFKIGADKIQKYRKTLIAWIIIAFAISLLSNIFTHLYWVNDPVTDFISFTPGKFSIIGYWHLVYSIIQMFILFMFPFFWVVAVKENNNEAIKYSHHTWLYVLAFSTLAIFDLLMKYFFVNHSATLMSVIQKDKLAFITVILSFLLLYIMKKYEKRIYTATSND